MLQATAAVKDLRFNQFNVFLMLKDASIHSFTFHNIIFAFISSDTPLVNAAKVLGVVRPALFWNPNQMLLAQEMVELL